jgi:hypothetical protein
LQQAPGFVAHGTNSLENRGIPKVKDANIFLPSQPELNLSSAVTAEKTKAMINYQWGIRSITVVRNYLYLINGTAAQNIQLPGK